MVTTSESELEQQVKNADSVIQLYVAELKKENLKLQKEIVKLIVRNESLNNEIIALKEQEKIPQANININL